MILVSDVPSTGCPSRSSNAEKLFALYSKENRTRTWIEKDQLMKQETFKLNVYMKVFLLVCNILMFFFKKFSAFLGFYLHGLAYNF